MIPRRVDVQVELHGIHLRPLLIRSEDARRGAGDGDSARQVG